MKKLLTICVSFLLVVNAYAFNKNFDTMVVFGDSLSDNGNLYRYFLHVLPVSPPYYEGHFSNGPLWAEYFYQNYFPEDYTMGFQNYAVGGAGAVISHKENLPFSLSAEISNYFYWHSYGKQETSLYTIWIGANNYVNEPSNISGITDKVVTAISDGIERLISKGGNKFLVVNLPDLSRLPQAKNSNKPWLLTELTLAHNFKLEEAVNALKIKYPDSSFIYLDVYTLFNDSMDMAEDFGFTNTTDACYLGGYTGWLVALNSDDDALYQNLKHRTPAMTEQQWLQIKNNPQLKEAALAAYFYEHLPSFQKTEEALQCDNYVFWDAVHPTTIVHKIVANAAISKINDAGLQAVLPEEPPKEG